MRPPAGAHAGIVTCAERDRRRAPRLSGVVMTQAEDRGRGILWIYCALVFGGLGAVAAWLLWQLGVLVGC